MQKSITESHNINTRGIMVLLLLQNVEVVKCVQHSLGKNCNSNARHNLFSMWSITGNLALYYDAIIPAF